jgi:hypothetical protein
MAKKKPAPKKKSAPRKKPAPGKKPVPKKTSAGRKKAAARGKKVVRRRSPLAASVTSLEVAPSPTRRGLGASSAGQSGDTQGLSRATDTDSESVEELIEEGQFLEAGVLGGVERADSEPGEVRTTQVLEDDVPREYDED